MNWPQLDRRWRLWWMECGVRITRGIGGPDLTRAIAEQLPEPEAATLRATLGSPPRAPYRSYR